MWQVPTRNWIRDGIFQSGKNSGNFEQTKKFGKNHTNTGKVEVFQINVIYYF